MISCNRYMYKGPTINLIPLFATVQIKTFLYNVKGGGGGGWKRNGLT